MRLNVEAWGPEDGALVACMHGITGRANRFRRLALERLAGFRVVSVDLRGHGASTHEPPWDIATHLADLVDTVDRPATWIGHSFGGRLVCELAVVRPELVERAVLLDPALHVLPENALALAEGARVDQIYGSFEEFVDRRIASALALRASRARVREELEGDLQGDRVVYCRSAVVTAYSEMARPAPPLPRAPTLVVLGADSYLPYVGATEPQVEVVTVPGGHTVLWDAFEETAEAVERFLNQR
ncbi:MAG: alpha/beta fold hydrolase [Gaiellaceae bacterium]